MWLEAVITREDLVHVLDEFLPVKIHLDEDDSTERWLLLGRATEVALVPDEGLHVLCPATLCWSLAGMNPTITLDPLAVMIRPEMVEKETGYVLEFQIEVEEADIHGLPSFIDTTIVKAVNGALAAKRFAWNFTETLKFSVDMPKTFQPSEVLKMGVGWGRRRISAEALVLAVSFKLGFVRGEADGMKQEEEVKKAERAKASVEHGGEAAAAQ